MEEQIGSGIGFSVNMATPAVFGGAIIGALLRVFTGAVLVRLFVTAINRARAMSIPMLSLVVMLPVLVVGGAAPARADGSKDQRESAPPAATVLGEEIRTTDPDELQSIVLTRLLDHYAEQKGIEVSEAEIDVFADNMQRGMRAMGLTAEEDLTPDEAVQAAQIRRDMGRAMILQWKLGKALYAQYGGRIIYQQLGPEPLDAYRRYLEERQATGDFEIHDQVMADAFWRYFKDDSRHSFYEPGSDDEAQAFEMPPWERTQPGS